MTDALQAEQQTVLANLLESASRTTSQDTGYPPYNIETTGENAYRIEIAVAGFGPDELNIEVKENLLTVQGCPTRRCRCCRGRMTSLSRARAWRSISAAPAAPFPAARPRR